MESYKRTNRIGVVIREEIANILRDEVKDPRLGMMSITRVDITQDLRHAHVYVSPFREEDTESILNGLQHARGFIQRQLALKKMKLRYTPVIDFHIDESIKRSAHIMDILAELKKDKEVPEE
ncbi:MAG: 30S ribosome-binding factor RbfA [bacterium]